MKTLQCGLKKKVTLLQYPKTVCIPCSGFAFLLSLCYMHWSKYRHPDLPFTCRSYNVKLFTFQLVVRGGGSACRPVVGSNFITLSVVG